MQSYPMQHVVAYRASDGGIGFQNRLLYRLEKDLHHFRSLTRHHIVLMGRRTYESIGHPLKDRVNVVLSKTLKIAPPGFELFSNLDEAVRWCQSRHQSKYIFVVGGEDLYRQTLPMTRMVYATEIVDESANRSAADCFYPPDMLMAFPRKDWIVSRVHSVDAVSGREYEYSIVAHSREKFMPET